jgi:hypothetical protein
MDAGAESKEESPCAEVKQHRFLDLQQPSEVLLGGSKNANRPDEG